MAFIGAFNIQEANALLQRQGRSHKKKPAAAHTGKKHKAPAKHAKAASHARRQVRASRASADEEETPKERRARLKAEKQRQAKAARLKAERRRQAARDADNEEETPRERRARLHAEHQREAHRKAEARHAAERKTEARRQAARHAERLKHAQIVAQKKRQAHERRLAELKRRVAQNAAKKAAAIEAENAPKLDPAPSENEPMPGEKRKPSQSIQYYCTKSAGVPLKVIAINLNDPHIKITGQLAKAGVGHAESFGKMVQRVQPTIAITGTFFSVSSLVPIGDIVIDGQLAHFGGMGTAMCITDSNDVQFIQPPRYIHQDWSKFDFVLCSGPRLITEGSTYVNPAAEGFRDKHMLNANGRIAVGITKDNKMLIVATRKPIYLSKLAKAMRGLGMVNAINLDGGSSVGMHVRGKTVIRPGRALTNLLLVYDNRETYEERKKDLAPAHPSAQN